MRRKTIVESSILGLIFAFTALVYTTIDTRFRGTYKTMPIETVKSIDADTTIKPLDYSTLTPEEAIKEISTPAQVNDYLKKYLIKSYKGRRESFAKTHEDRKGLCLDYAIAASALLIDNNYQPNMLILEKERDEEGHAVFLYRTSKGYGALGLTPMSPIYPSVDSLIKDLNRQYKRDLTQYALVDVDKTYSRSVWLRGNKNLQFHLPRNQWIPVK